jgi:hypothetical protein
MRPAAAGAGAWAAAGVVAAAFSICLVI